MLHTIRRLARHPHFLSLTTFSCHHIPTPTLNCMLHHHYSISMENDARRLFDQNPTSRSIGSWNMMIASYLQSGQLRKAQDLFDQMPVKDVVSWNTMLSGLRKSKNPHGVYICFIQMMRIGFRPNDHTISVVVSAVLKTEFIVLVPQIHVFEVKSLAPNPNVFVGSALMVGYANLGNPVAMSRVFDEILERDVTSWNALVSGYMEMGYTKEALRVFDAMPEKNVVSWTSLLKGYIHNRMINKARDVFNKMGERNVVSWTAMINGYVQNQNLVNGWKLFRLMLRSGTIPPNHFTFSSVLDACAGCSSLLMGQQVHTGIVKYGIPDDIVLSTSLVDMYAKCGDTDAAFRVFEAMPIKNLVSWNSLIGGCARNGRAMRALEMFNRMTETGTKPDEVTFINLLWACGHGGLVEEGEKHFDSMVRKYGILAGLEHYACMVDLYGRAGQLEKAYKLIKVMPFEPDVVVWGALLGACCMYSSLELGDYAAQGIKKLKDDHPAIYSMLSKIHGEKGAWSSVAELKGIMKKKNVMKQTAGSWIVSDFGKR
ncbi:pentatricopeptide repeat-containing protein At2g13600-like [Ziziphus jujuba]|uniref:Pentatricopeptide repeat-containing protein At2g13600-like n=1 Tax=Ziziphus jujuba TaxID=326968 RepID=A0A6P4B0D1_ZIZJJ|nr:pentatricopeptide repeat-containing protein At2g13600-like [Ziziphus jujuba]